MNYYGIDVPKKYSVFARMNQQGKILAESRIDNTPAALAVVLEPAHGGAQVALEACGLWHWVYDLLKPHGAPVTLPHPQATESHGPRQG
jgi:hypothetical protein